MRTKSFWVRFGSKLPIRYDSENFKHFLFDFIEIFIIQTYFNPELHLSKHCHSHSDFALQYLSSETPTAASCPPLPQDNLSKRSSNPSSSKHTIERTLSWHTVRSTIFVRPPQFGHFWRFSQLFSAKNRNFQISSSFYWAILKISILLAKIILKISKKDQISEPDQKF